MFVPVTLLHYKRITRQKSCIQNIDNYCVNHFSSIGIADFTGFSTNNGECSDFSLHPPPILRKCKHKPHSTYAFVYLNYTDIVQRQLKACSELKHAD